MLDVFEHRTSRDRSTAHAPWSTPRTRDRSATSIPPTLDAGPRWQAREALRRSCGLIRGRLWEMIVLGLSFLPWLLLTAATIVPALFLLDFQFGIERFADLVKAADLI